MKTQARAEIVEQSSALPTFEHSGWQPRCHQGARPALHKVCEGKILLSPQRFHTASVGSGPSGTALQPKDRKPLALRLCGHVALVRTSPDRQGLLMSVRRTVTVSITPEQDALLRAFLASGRYRSISEVLRSALRLLERDEAATLAAIRSPAAHGEANRG